MLNLTVNEFQLIAEERAILVYRDMPRKEFEILFSNKYSPETVYLDS